MDGTVSIDGVLQDASDARVSVFDRGFLYGDSAFEAMRTYGGVAFRERAHLERLLRSCARVRIGFDRSVESMARELRRTVDASGLEDCYLRLVVTRGTGSMGLALETARTPVVVIYALALPTLDPAMHSEGIAVSLANFGRATDGTSGVGAKTSNYLGAALALDEARRVGASETIVLSDSGQVVEGSTSNVFMLRAGTIHTPPAGAGILEGITRRVVFELADSMGIPVREGLLFPADFYRCDEAFITSSIREVVPVVRVDDVDVGDGTPGPVARRLLSAYRDLTRAECARVANPHLRD